MPAMRMIVLRVIVLGLLIMMIMVVMIIIMVGVIVGMIVMIVVTAMVVVGGRHRGAARGRAVERLPRRDEPASLHPQEPQADEDDQPIAHGLDHVHGTV